MASFVRTLPLIGFLLFVAFPLAMVALLVWVAIRTRAQAQLVAAMPTSNAAFATDGYVELEGQAQAISGRMIKTPLSGIECVWYRARLEQWRATSSEEATWSVVHDVTSSDPFLFTDGSGTCVILPAGAEVTFTDRSIWYGPDPIPQDKNPARTGPGESPEGNIRVHGTGNKYRYTEERIYAGDPLLVLGQFSTAPWNVDDDDDDDVDDETDAAEEGQDTESDETSQEIANAGSGVDWDPFEREYAMIAEAAKITNRRVIRPPSQPYLLSTTPQAKLLDVQSTGWKAALGVAIVPAAIVALLVWLRLG